jgi:hypothetical protein
MNGTDVIIVGLFILLFTLLTLKFIASPCAAKVEKFQDISQNTMKCPRGTKSFTNSDGNIQCCRGEVTGNRCEGNVACKISASADTIPFCKAGFQKKWNGEIPDFIKFIVKNNSYDKIRNIVNEITTYLVTGGGKYKDPKIINDCAVKREYDAINNLFLKEMKYYDNFVKQVQNGNYESKAEIDEIVEDFLAYYYNAMMSLYMPYITKLETCIQLKNMQ